MLVEEVRKMAAAPRRFVYWIKEREYVRLRRQADLLAPWTDDEILQQYRFCNVVRMDDKVSRWLMDHWYTPHKDHHNMLAACALARFINLPSSLEEITRDVFHSGGDPWWDSIKRTLREMKKHGAVFNGAYMVRGNDGQDKVSSVVDFYVGSMLEVHRKSPLIRPASMEDTHSLLTQQYGFGSFMAGQVVADLRWAVTGAWADRNAWAPIGPGSHRGMNRLMGAPLKKPMSQETFLNHLRLVMKMFSSKLSGALASRMEAHDWQNCLCEFDKYERVLWGEGKPKQIYRGK